MIPILSYSYFLKLVVQLDAHNVVSWYLDNGFL